MRQKKIWGRKRHLLVDTLGWPIGVLVTSAQWYDPYGAEELLLRLPKRLNKLWLILADGIYQRHKFTSWVKDRLQVEVRQTQEPPKVPPVRQLVLSPTGHYHMVSGRHGGAPGQRWVVERSFAWLSRLRRLARDVEGDPASSEAFITLAFSRLVLRRLAPDSS